MVTGVILSIKLLQLFNLKKSLTWGYGTGGSV